MRDRGLTLLEVMIGVTLLAVVVVLFAGVSGSFGRTASRGQRALEIRSENEKALQSLVSELQNTSSAPDPDTLVPRLTVEDGGPVELLVTRTAESLAEGDRNGTVTVGPIPEVLDSRPRLLQVSRNSRLVFRRVVGHEIDPLYGDVLPRWSEPVTYSVEERRLVRREGDTTRVIGTNVSVFRAIAEPDGNVTVFLRSQKRDPNTGEVLDASNVIEVRPRN